MPDTHIEREPAASIACRAGALFTAYQQDIYQHTDRLFAALMGIQWIAGIVFALWVSPLTWSGPVSRTHLHVWAAILVGGTISLFPAVLALTRPGRPSTRYTIAVAQMLMGALLIHLTGGRLETHFHVFGSLAFLAFYRDWRVLVPATIVVALDHMLRGMFWPQSVYGVLVVSQWRWVEHAAWVIFENIFLLVSIHRSVSEMRETAERTATLEQEVRTRQLAETDARNSRARNDAILDVALDPVILMDERGHIVQFNPAAERTFGYSAAEAVGIELAALIVPAGQHGEHHAGLPPYPETGHTALVNQRLELAAIRKGGQHFPVEVAIAPISSDGSAMFAGYLRDITERRQAESAVTERMLLERQNADQLATLVEQLRETQRQAEAATRAKSDFLASMSHELRTPLNAIILYSELLQEEAQDEGYDRSILDLQRIQSAGKHLLELINGILDLSKIEAGKMALSLETFGIKAMIDQLIDTVGPVVQQNNNVLTVICHDDIGTMSADLMKTRQILLNLLGNAAKFTRAGAVTVEARRCLVGGVASVAFTVTDTGVGMTSEQSERIFDAFTQADVTTTRKYGGTGLGLAIVSRFCQLMGGSVSVESRVRDGSCFTVYLPIEVIDPAIESPLPADAA
jgi:two-component system sensor histidine kinase/response regulator